jgi:hypothetical protein
MRGLRSQSKGLEKGTGAGDKREDSMGKGRGKIIEGYRQKRQGKKAKGL